MSAGILIPSLINIAASESESLIFGSGNNQPGLSLEIAGPWTPPQYSHPAITILSVLPTSNSSTGQETASQIDYVFDAVFRILHNRRARKTSHPVLTGANISDHIIIEPARVTLEIGMSDAMSSFSSDIWVGTSSKSVSAWQILKNLYISKTLVNLTTRLDSYVNMSIIDLQAPDDRNTNRSLKATVVLEELLSASVISVTSQSVRPQTTGSNSSGVVQSVSPNPSQVEQNVIPSPLYPSVTTYPSVPGAGSISSNTLSTLPQK